MTYGKKPRAQRACCQAGKYLDRLLIFRHLVTPSPCHLVIFYGAGPRQLPAVRKFGHTHVGKRPPRGCRLRGLCGYNRGVALGGLADYFRRWQN